MPATVVVPLDSSEAAELALPLAESLARRRQTSLTLFSVIETPVEYDVWLDSAMVALDEEIPGWVANRQTYLDEIAGTLQGIPVHSEVRTGLPGEEISKFLRELDNPVTVMASHGRGGLGQLVVGSVALQVVHDVHSPVIILRMSGSDAQVAASAFDTVLIPIDHSEFSESILYRVLQVVGEPKPVVHLLHVLETPSWTHHSFNHGLISKYMSSTEDRIKEHIRQLVTQLEERGYEASWEVRKGRPDQEILNAATDRGATEIAMATHGRGSVGRTLLGSVAQRVLHDADVPLLLIHPDDAQKAQGEAS